MTRFPQSLPTEAVAVLAGQSKAKDISEGLFAAFWMHGRDDLTALYLLQQAHSDFADLADAMGYTIARKDAPTVASLKAEWHGICEAMNQGSYRGTEAEALARIDAIKSEIARLEQAA